MVHSAEIVHRRVNMCNVNHDADVIATHATRQPVLRHCYCPLRIHTFT